MDLKRLILSLATLVLASSALATSSPPIAPEALEAFEVYARPQVPPANGIGRWRSRGKITAPMHGWVLAATPDKVSFGVLLYVNHERVWAVMRTAGWTTHHLVPGTHIRAGEGLGTAGALDVEVWTRTARVAETHRALDAVVDQESLEASGFAKVDDVEAFTRRHRRLMNPVEEKRLVLIDKDHYALQIREHGAVVVQLRVGFGQTPGQKRVQGDLKTPSGMYFVTHKARREFGGKWGAYFGGHWIKINYPNAFDAEWGVQERVVTRSEARAIGKAWAARGLPSQSTRLGGGIGFHGWIGPRTTRDDWSDDDPYQTWGCVLLHNVDIAAHYSRIAVGTMVVLW